MFIDLELRKGGRLRIQIRFHNISYTMVLIYQEEKPIEKLNKFVLKSDDFAFF